MDLIIIIILILIKILYILIKILVNTGSKKFSNWRNRPRKNDYGDDCIFYGLFIAPKVKYCSIINEIGIIVEKRTFGDFGDANRLLERKQYFESSEGKTISGKFPITQKKTFENGVVIALKIKDFEDCRKASNGMCEVWNSWKKNLSTQWI